LRGVSDICREKVVLLGDAGVGKSSLIRRFVFSTFDDKYISTLGTNISKKTLNLDGPRGPVELIQTIWDVVGQADFQSVQNFALKGARGLLLVCDATRRETFEHFAYWLKFTDEAVGAIPTILAVNKWDLADRKVTRAEVEELAGKIGVPFLLTSAKTGEGVEAAFEHLGTEMLFGRKPDLSWLAGVETTERPVDALLGLEDQLIATFCAMAGNLEVSMPIIRHKFREVGIDFTRPTPEQLHEVVKRLVAAVQSFTTPEQAEKLRQELLKIVRQALPGGLTPAAPPPLQRF